MQILPITDRRGPLHTNNSGAVCTYLKLEKQLLRGVRVNEFRKGMRMTKVTKLPLAYFKFNKYYLIYEISNIFAKMAKG